MGCNYTDAELTQAIKLSCLDNFIKQNGLGFLLEEDGGNISGGQKQRIGLARAMLFPKQILLIDEGTSALNSELAHIVRSNYLQTFSTVIEVAHWIEPINVRKFNQVINLK